MESEKSEEVFNSPFYHFWVDFFNNYKYEHPEDKLVAAVNVKVPNWWETMPKHVDEAAEEQWSRMSDAEKAFYALQAKKIRDEEEALASYAFAIFRNEYIGVYKKIHPKDKSFADLSMSPGGWWSGCPEHVGEAALAAWQIKKSKAKYFSMAKEAKEAR